MLLFAFACSFSPVVQYDGEPPPLGTEACTVKSSEDRALDDPGVAGLSATELVAALDGTTRTTFMAPSLPTAAGGDESFFGDWSLPLTFSFATAGLVSEVTLVEPAVSCGPGCDQCEDGTYLLVPIQTTWESPLFTITTLGAALWSGPNLDADLRVFFGEDGAWEADPAFAEWAGEAIEEHYEAAGEEDASDVVVELGLSGPPGRGSPWGTAQFGVSANTEDHSASVLDNDGQWVE